MQKSILLLAAALLLGTSLGAQAQRRGRAKSSTYNTSLGLKAGVAVSNFVGADAGDPDYLAGFQGGIFANISLSQLVAFQPELLYSRKGERFKTSDASLKLDYIDVPLAFHINTDGLFFELGPQVGFLFNAKQQRGSVSVDVTNSFNTVDFGYLGGLGFQFKQGVGLGVRYNGGFVNVPAAVNAGPITFQSRQRNSSLQAYLTYSFNSH